jgi:hypothetical protein
MTPKQFAKAVPRPDHEVKRLTAKQLSALQNGLDPNIRKFNPWRTLRAAERTDPAF